MGRYLMYIAYNGRGFHGLQRQNGFTRVPTIIEAIEEGLKSINPGNSVYSVTSSRTDSGVNALCNTIHTDLQPRDEDVETYPDYITSAINRAMYDQNYEIRVLRTLRVPDNFHCRFNAKSRTYVYRSTVCTQATNKWVLPCTPHERMTSCLSHKNLVDVSLVQRVADMLSGTYDYSAFSKKRSLQEQPWINPVKTLQVSVADGIPFMGHHLPEFCKEGLVNLEFIFKANSFLYKQVRKMSAVMLAVGSGVLDLDVVARMLEKPHDDEHFKNTNLYNIPSHGLFLKEVEYDPRDLVYPPPEGSNDNPCISPLGGRSDSVCIPLPGDSSDSAHIPPGEGSSNSACTPQIVSCSDTCTVTSGSSTISTYTPLPQDRSKTDRTEHISSTQINTSIEDIIP